MANYLRWLQAVTDNSEQPAGVDRAQCLNGICCALKYLHSRTPSIVLAGLAASGKIYISPAGARQVLSIDRDTQTVEMLGPDMQGNFKYLAGSG